MREAEGARAEVEGLRGQLEQQRSANEDAVKQVGEGGELGAGRGGLEIVEMMASTARIFCPCLLHH